MNNKKTVIHGSNKGFSLIEVLIIVLIIGILSGHAIFKNHHFYEQGVTYIKIETANAFNKAIQTAYIKGYVIDDSYISELNVTTESPLDSQYNKLEELLDVLYLGKKTADQNYDEFESPLTLDSYNNIKSNLNSKRFRDTTDTTGTFTITGSTHSNLEVVYLLDTP